MASRSDVELEDEAALMLQPEGLGALAVVAFEEEEAAEAHRSTSDEWWNLPPYNENQSPNRKKLRKRHHLNKRQSSNVSILFCNDGQP
ncbi:BnaC01g36770D [Brassica napus]|uniref:BnaC01g36770D protein n=1 Tax=Brassica napus TaxID=3708 RepID=A0A078H6B0_BRANA|nr:BnaC01g36770D [Brassica napus]